MARVSFSFFLTRRRSSRPRHPRPLPRSTSAPRRAPFNAPAPTPASPPTRSRRPVLPLELLAAVPLALHVLHELVLGVEAEVAGGTVEEAGRGAELGVVALVFALGQFVADDGGGRGGGDCGRWGLLLLRRWLLTWRRRRSRGRGLKRRRRRGGRGS